MPSASTMIPPAVPVRLMIAFALERKGLTVTSGISATAGERKVAIATSTTSSVAINPIKGKGFATVSSTVVFLTSSANSASAMVPCSRPGTPAAMTCAS